MKEGVLGLIMDTDKLLGIFVLIIPASTSFLQVFINLSYFLSFV